MNIYRAKNVFIGLNHGESAYWQVNAGNTVINPAPWTDSLLPGEPDFSWCGASDAAVRICCSLTLSHRLNAHAHLLNKC
jgi:glucan 1,3-beta-glucosidase